MKKQLFFILFSFGILSVIGQSLKQEIRNSYLTIEKNFFNKKLDQTLFLIQNLEEKSTKSNPDLLPIIDSYYGLFFNNKKDNDKALKHLKKAIKNSVQSKNDEVKAYVNYAMGVYYHSLNDYKTLHEYALEALKYAEQTDNHKLLGDIYYRLYCVHTEWNDLKTDEFAQKALSAYKKIQDYNGMANAYAAKVFGVKNQFAKTKNTIYKDSVVYYLRRTVTLNSEHPNKLFQKTVAMSCLNLANYFREQYVNQKKMGKEEAIDSIYKYLNVVDKIPSAIDYNFVLRSNSANIKSNLALYHDNINKAEKLFLNSFLNLKSVKNPSYYALFNTAIGLKQLYVIKGNYKKAYEYLKEQYNYNELIYNKAQNNKIKALEAKFENEQIKKALDFQKKKNKAKKIQLYLSIGLLILALIIIGLMIKNFKTKILAKQQKVELLNQEKTAALAKVKLQEEQYARLLAERKILETEKEKVQKKAMANAIQIERKNQLLKEIQEKLEQNNLRLTELKSTLKLERHTEEQLKTKLDEFSDINPTFFEKLKEVSNNKITNLDLKYCAYFYLGLSNKEIANNLNIEAKSVRMTKYRIKKKLNINEEDIHDFLKKIGS